MGERAHDGGDVPRAGRSAVPRWERRLRWAVGLIFALALLLSCGSVAVLPDALWADERFVAALYAVVNGVTLVALPPAILLIARAVAREPAVRGMWGVYLLVLSVLILLLLYGYWLLLSPRAGPSDDRVALSGAFAPLAVADLGLFALGTVWFIVDLARETVGALRRGRDGERRYE